MNLKISNNMNPQKHINENEQIEKAEYDRDIRIAEQKRFDASFGRTISDLEPREARLADMAIYKLGNLEY